MKGDLERQRIDRERLRARVIRAAPIQRKDLKNIDAFRADARYGADGTRTDLAYAVYALSHGTALGEVEAAIRSRDLSHKGNERRQNDYVARTTKKRSGSWASISPKSLLCWRASSGDIRWSA